MKKLRITATVTEAMSFAWNNFGNLIRLGWVPLLLVLFAYAGGRYFFLQSIGLDFLEIDFTDKDALSEFRQSADWAISSTQGGWLLSFVLSIVTAFFLAPLYVVMFRYAIDDVPLPRQIAHFTFGQRELRYAGAAILFSIISIVALIVFAPAGFSLMKMANNMPLEVWSLTETDPMAFEQEMEKYVTEQSVATWGLPFFISILVGIIAYIWLMMRLTAFMPLVAVENRLGLMRAFRMTKGNFWRILMAVLLLTIMIMLGLFVAILALLVVVFIFVFLISMLPGGIGLAVGALFAIGGYVVFMAFFYGIGIGFSSGIYGQLRDNAD
jgi:hypothetical protein